MLDVSIVSEDLGSPMLSGHVLEDFRGFGESIVYKRFNTETIFIDPGHLDSPPRDISYSLTFPVDEVRGCHSVTLVVTHAFKDPGANVLKLAKDGDLGTATWWFGVDIDAEPTNPVLLNSCVVVGATTLDAGLEAAADLDARAE
jgi:hypothetical protein